jgi:hypothetical protein
MFVQSIGFSNAQWFYWNFIAQKFPNFDISTWCLKHVPNMFKNNPYTDFGIE